VENGENGTAMKFVLLTSSSLRLRIDATIELEQGRDPRTKLRGAEGASLKQAKPDETLRQKDPAPVLALESTLRV
jgi:hypothetical protein